MPLSASIIGVKLQSLLDPFSYGMAFEGTLKVKCAVKKAQKSFDLISIKAFRVVRNGKSS